ncbi:spore gernimation protein [Psychrobacillus glaciei]|uniref:Spore gernimation protein n=1 Tax=Psychrobacillus glaciei TaxID=2283160 RepID=A0A5J6STD2_9BACI|nr:endospore germination permease [Psychrobacillus glaciei]QFG00764.1 spore gernimation protein [Psychrobacillus glaciei]
MRGIGPISILHVIFLSMTVIGLKNHVTIIPPLLHVAGRDGWASVILAAVAIVPWLLLLVYIHHKSDQAPIKDWLKSVIGGVGSTIVLYITGLYFILLAAFSMVETLKWITTTFLPKTPIVLMLIIYVILCILLVSTNIQTIAMVNVMVLFGVILLGFFVAIVNIQVKDYGLLRPFFEHGFQSVYKGMVYPASGFVELLLLLFLQHHFKDRIRWYHFALMLFILMGLTIGPLMGAITEFGPVEAAKQRYPAYEEWGLVSLGHYIEHMDFFSIYQWLTGAFIRVGFILFVVADMLNMSKEKKRIWVLLAPAFFLICLLLFFLSDSLFLEIKSKYFLISNYFFFLLLSLLLTTVALVSGKTSKKI